MDNTRRRSSSQTQVNTENNPPTPSCYSSTSLSPRTPISIAASFSTTATPSSSTTTATNYYSALVSPIHQRFIELEFRLKRWRIFKRLTNHRRSASTDPQQKIKTGAKEIEESIRTNKSSSTIETILDSPGSLTCPLTRKKLQMNLSGTPRPRPKLDAVSSSDSLSPEEVSRRFQAIQEQSGTLNVNGTIFRGVKFEDLERFDQNAQLGDGAGGSVSKYKLKSRIIAVKQMKRSDSIDESKRIFMDLEVISKCNDCPYIVKYYGYIITFDFVFICMEVMATCLEKLLLEREKSRTQHVGLPEEIIGKIALSVVRALDYLKEKHKIMHRDIKPSNILLDWYGNFKLCDFGISGKLIESKASTKIGCTGYMAPERINLENNKVMPYDVRADVWSLGITLVQLAEGRHPYHEKKNQFELLIKIKDDNPPLISESDGFSKEFCQFIADCLQKDMALRPKFRDLLDKPFLQHAANNEVDVSLWFSDPVQYEALNGRS